MTFRWPTFFTDSETIKYYQKTCGWNSKSTKTKNYIAWKVAWHKSITINLFFLSEIISREKMVSLSNNDRFYNNIFLCNIWNFSVIKRINHVIFFIFTLKTHDRTLLQISEQLVTARCKVQHMCVANITNILNERDCVSQTI